MLDGRQKSGRKEEEKEREKEEGRQEGLQISSRIQVSDNLFGKDNSLSTLGEEKTGKIFKKFNIVL